LAEADVATLGQMDSKINKKPNDKGAELSPV